MEPTVADRRHGYRTALIALVILLALGNHLWRQEISRYSGNIYQPLTMTPSLTPDNRLDLHLRPPGVVQEILATRRLDGLARKIFIHSWLRWLGRYSYGIYVWHPILAGFVIAPTRHLVARITPGKGAQMLAGAFTGMAASLLLGYISYHAYEVHFLRLKRFFAYRG